LKDYLAQILRSSPSTISGRLIAREYLQARLLESVQEHGGFARIVFLGGTALRFLYRIPRFSEYLDFLSIAAGVAPDLDRLAVKARIRLEAEGYALHIHLKTGVVASAEFRFPGLYHELGLSPQREETIMIKLEVDTNPPQGAGVTSTLVRRHVLLNLRHYDRASLLSGKLHAVLSRRYTKGRDLFDLAWYLADRSWPEPNITLLQNALAQTEWSGPPVNRHSWRGVVADRLADLDWKAAIADVGPFLESPGGAAALTRGGMLALLSER
jgi:hypothetical protein